MRTPQEHKQTPPPTGFIERELNGGERAQCVDGRPDRDGIAPGPHMLGGSLHPIVLRALYTGKALDSLLVSNGITKLKMDGFTPGVHHGSHRNLQEGKSDCGFADRLSDVLATAVDRKDEIRKRLLDFYEMHKAQIGKFETSFEDMLDVVFDCIGKYPLESIYIDGEELIQVAVDAGAHMGLVVGDHREQVAFLNTNRGTTFDTNKANEEGWQAFNLDLVSAVEQSKPLHVPKDFSIPASLILYQATEMVLVEQKGKPGLSIQLHS